MRITSSIDSELCDFLRIKGFKQRGNVFLRIHGDGVLQCIFSEKTPRTKFSENFTEISKPVSVSIRSIFEPNVFGDVRIYRGALTYPYSLSDFCSESDQVYSYYKLLSNCCVPTLDKVSTQASLYELIYRLDKTCYNEIRWYMEMLTIPSLMYLKEYSTAKKVCERVLSCNSNLSHVVQMYKLLLVADGNKIQNFLNQVRLNNLSTYQQLRFR